MEWTHGQLDINLKTDLLLDFEDGAECRFVVWIVLQLAQRTNALSNNALQFTGLRTTNTQLHCGPKILHPFHFTVVLQMLTNCYNIRCIVYQGNLQHNNYRFTHLTYTLLLHYRGENYFSSSKSVCTPDNRATAAWNVWRSFLQAYGIQITLIFTPLTAKYGAWCRIISDSSSRCGRPEAALDWHLLQSIVDGATDELRKRLPTCVDKKRKPFWTLAVIFRLSADWLCGLDKPDIFLFCVTAMCNFRC